MKVRFFQLSGLVLMGLMFVGCGSKESAPAASIPAPTSAEQAGAAQANASGAKVETPDAIVSAFLESLRSGNDAVAAALLTDKARVETQKQGLKVQPPGTPDMTYQIGQTELINPDGAHVGSIWSNKLESGEVESFDVIWVLRREPQGWRIAGMATPPTGPESEALFFNFEDPADLLQTWEEAEGQLAEQEAPANGQPAPQQDAPSLPASNNQFAPAENGQNYPQNNGQFVPPGNGQFVPQGGSVENTANGDVNPLRR
jgi:hypothetical protein